MNITLEYIEKRRTEFNLQKEQLIANLNVLQGALQLLIELEQEIKKDN